MTPESIPRVLPLAAALRAWSDPDLLRAVEMAEAPFTPDQCDQHQRQWLAEIVHHRKMGKEMRRHGLDPRLHALERAWYALFAHFSGKVASGEIVLWGWMTRPFRRRDPEPLPAASATELLYYPRQNTILFREDAYWDVTAEPAANAIPCDERLRQMRTTAGAVPLVTALREWTDPLLVSEVCRHERDHTEYEIAGFPMYPLLCDVQDLAKPSDRRWTLGPPDFTRLLRAWEALEDDFRARLVRGEFRLQGVMAKPRRELEATLVPGVWAADFVFDFQRGTVSFDDARYLAVTVSYGAGEQRAEIPDDPSAAPNGALGDQATETAAAGVKQHLGGRKNTRIVVEEALRAHWDDLFRNGAPQDPGPWTAFAARLIKRVGTSGHERRIGFPKEETVRKHLPEIYARLLVEKGEIAPNDQ